MILIVQHVDIEGAGAMGRFFENTAWDCKVLDIYNSCYTPCRSRVFSQEGNIFPRDFSGLEAVIVLGGPMNVYQVEEFPFLKEETVFLKKVMEREIPLLGICLGAQMIARTCGVKVGRADKKEIGWSQVVFTEEGKKDPVFKDICGSPLTVFQWHEDTFDLPEKAVLLATGPECPNQAFRLGKNTYGFQFHVEITAEMIVNWADAYLTGSDPSTLAMANEMLKGYYRRQQDYDHTAQKFCLNFSRIISDRSPDFLPV